MNLKENSSEPRSRSKRNVFFAVYVIIVLIVGLANSGVLFPQPRHELIDTTSLISWVPGYVLYTPLGETSYCECYANYTPFRLMFEGTSNGISVHSIQSTRMGFAYFASSVDYSGYLLSALYLNQTWNLWRNSDGTNEWFEIELANFTYRGGGTFGSDTPSYMNSRGMRVDEMPDETNPYMVDWYVAPGTTKSITIDWTQPEFAPLGASYMVHIFGHDILLNISISADVPITNTYVLGNGTNSLNVQMMCNGPITQITENHYETDGALIWFQT
jgi:hypothetical protein